MVDSTLNIKVDTGASVKEVNRLGKALDKTEKSGNKAAKQSKKTEGAIKRMGQSAQGAAGSMKGLVAGLVAFATVGFAKSVLDTERSVQKMKAQLVTMTGSMENAEMAFEKLNAINEKIPFNLEETVGAFTKMTALGLEPSERAILSYANTAAAMGKSLEQMYEAVADAATGEFERLKEFGIKASQNGDEVALTFQGQTKTIKKSAAEIQKYLIQIGEVEFAGAATAQMDTLNGQISNLGVAWEKFKSTLAKELPFKEIISGLTGIVSWLTTEWIPVWKGAFGIIKELAVGTFTNIFSAFQGTGQNLGALLLTWQMKFEDFWSWVKDLFVTGPAFIAAQFKILPLKIARSLFSLRITMQRTVAGLKVLWGKLPQFILEKFQSAFAGLARAAESVGLDSLAGKLSDMADTAGGASQRIMDNIVREQQENEKYLVQSRDRLTEKIDLEQQILEKTMEEARERAKAKKAINDQNVALKDLAKTQKALNEATKETAEKASRDAGSRAGGSKMRSVGERVAEEYKRLSSAKRNTKSGKDESRFTQKITDLNAGKEVDLGSRGTFNVMRFIPNKIIDDDSSSSSMAMAGAKVAEGVKSGIQKMTNTAKEELSRISESLKASVQFEFDMEPAIAGYNAKVAELTREPIRNQIIWEHIEEGAPPVGAEDDSADKTGSKQV